VPIIGLTASVLPGQLDALRAAGMDGHIVKPLRRDDLCAAVARWRLDLHEGEARPDARPPLDRAIYDGLLDLVGPDKVKSLLDQLAAQLTARFQGEPDTDEDRDRLARDAHAMISAAGAVGFSALSGACQALDDACTANRDVPEALHAVREARRLALRLIPALKQPA
jgi:HPt (histidine-containing phosphotransfer) domain-containing protein